MQLFRFGIEVTKTTESAKKRNSRLKQQGIKQFIVASASNEVSKKRWNDDGDFDAPSKRRHDADDEADADVELRRVMALSVETKRLEDERRGSDRSDGQKPEARREPRTPLKKLLEDNSLDEIPTSKPSANEPKFKFVGSPVRKRADRKALPAFECHDCRNFYAGANLSEEQLQELLQKCSKHRRKNPPPQYSPKVCWELEIREDNSQNKTQVGPPLRTRKRRKAEARQNVVNINIDDDDEPFFIDDQSEDSQII